MQMTKCILMSFAVSHKLCKLRKKNHYCTANKHVCNYNLNHCIYLAAVCLRGVSCGIVWVCNVREWKLHAVPKQEEILKTKCFALPQLPVYFQLLKAMCMFQPEPFHFHSKTGISEGKLKKRDY